MVKRIKSFSISIVTRKPVILKQPLISIMSEINLPLSPINLFFFFTEAVCCEEINVSKINVNLFEIALYKIFVSTFNKKIGLQFFK